MLRYSTRLLRRGKPRPKASLFLDKYRRVPLSHRPMQGGQDFFNDFMLRSADEDLRISGETGALESGGSSSGSASKVTLRLPQSDFAATRAAMEAQLAQNGNEADGHETRRSFNELQWFEEEAKQMAAGPDGALSNVSPSVSSGMEPDGTLLPDRVTDNEYFKSRFGYSLVKETELKPQIAYSELDLWAELPKYHRDMIFLYVISRRRNTYAVCFDYEGKRLLKPYTVGNRGLKGGDRGFRGEGSTDNGHQVMSMYINDVIPLVREKMATQGRPLARGDKVDVVVRVMGFYNGRQGAVRAITDRSDVFNVRYFEDVTPFPLNGPKMPRGVFK